MKHLIFLIFASVAIAVAMGMIVQIIMFAPSEPDFWGGSVLGTLNGLITGSALFCTPVGVLGGIVAGFELRRSPASRTAMRWMVRGAIYGVILGGVAGGLFQVWALRNFGGSQGESSWMLSVCLATGVLSGCAIGLWCSSLQRRALLK